VTWLPVQVEELLAALDFLVVWIALESQAGPHDRVAGWRDAPPGALEVDDVAENVFFGCGVDRQVAIRVLLDPRFGPGLEEGLRGLGRRKGCADERRRGSHGGAETPAAESARVR